MLVTRRDNTRMALLVLSVMCFLLSLAMPAFRFTPDDPWFKFSGGNDLWPGFLVLLLGWIGLGDGVVAWLSNPLWFIALLIGNDKSRLPTLLSAAAFCFAITSFFITEVPNEKRAFHSLGIGFYVWLVSILLLFIASIIGIRATPNKVSSN